MKGKGAYSRSRPVRRTGSISLALCLMLPVILLLFNSILLNSRRSRAQVDLVRGTVLTAQSALALYDRQLYSDFGLFALDRPAMDLAVSSLVGPGPHVRYLLTADRPLAEAGVLRQGIARHMSLRSISSLLADALDKLDGIRFLKDRIDLSFLSDLLPDLPGNRYQAVDPQLDFSGEEPPWLDEYQALMDDEIRSVYQEGLAILAPAAFPREDGEFENLAYDPFEGSGLDRLGKILDGILFVAPEGILDRIILSEYSLAYFVNDVPFQVSEGERREDRTPDGRIISRFPEERKREAEEIATGLTGGKAAATVNMFIGAVRFLLHLIHILTDQAKMSQYRTTAAGLSAAISVISMGEVTISPEILTWILIGSATLILSAKDIGAMRQGQTVNLWPGDLAVNLPMRYRDYLRLLILVQSPDIIATRIASVLGRLHPGPYYTGLICQGDWEGIRVTHAASYLGRGGQSEEAGR